MKEIINELLKGNINCLTIDKVIEINSMTSSLLNKKSHNKDEIDLMEDILHISNILYNNTDRNLLPLEDGIYDLLLELYKNYNPNYQVGAEPIFFDLSDSIFNKEVKSPFKKYISDEDIEEMLFYDDLNKSPNISNLDVPFRETNYNYINKRIVESEQNHPSLVGTLDKCKFVLNKQAKEKGVFEDSNVRILERDFFGKHILSGILNPNRKFKVVVELKYDGVSVVGDISNTLLKGAISRGDTNKGFAADLTPLFYGYRFINAPNIDIAIKFEAIMTYPNLERYNQLKNKDYKNCRTAISGLVGSSDGAMYRDLVTLVPLATSLSETENLNRIEEIEFLNKYYSTGESLRYAVIEGDYKEVLFQIKMFVEEAELMRNYLPFMYDGIVVSYLDKDLIKALGRSNSVNKYSCAVKFNPLKKQTIFNGYTYTIGQDGKITPMINYNPVEFYGTIHNKSTGHSYERFKNLNLRLGDIIEVEYVNDVMPYVTKPENSYNESNINPVEQFITNCPSCGSVLEVSQSGKTIYCNNPNCPAKRLKRVANMFDKLNIKDFSEAYLSRVDVYSLNELFNLKVEDVEFLGELNSKKFIDRINSLKINPINDYTIIGSLGFTGVAEEKWKLILNKVSIEELINLYYNNNLYNTLSSIKGIGPLTIQTIENEFKYFLEDLKIISCMNNVIRSKGDSEKLSIRFTGFRDKELMEYLQSLGYDASDKGVTKSTNILLIPYKGFTSSKTSKVGDKTIIVDVNEFKDNMNKYIDCVL